MAFALRSSQEYLPPSSFLTDFGNMAIYGEMEGIEILFDMLQQSRLRQTVSVVFGERFQTTTEQRWQIVRSKTDGTMHQKFLWTNPVVEFF